MSLWLAIPVLAVLAVMQTSMVPHIAVGAARPGLVMTWVVCWAVVRGRGEAMPWAIFGGLLLDVLSQLPFGAHLLALTAVTYVADLGHRVMQGSTALFAAAAVFAFADVEAWPATSTGVNDTTAITTVRAPIDARNRRLI